MNDDRRAQYDEIKVSLERIISEYGDPTGDVAKAFALIQRARKREEMRGKISIVPKDEAQ